MGGSDASKRQRQGQSVGIGPRCRVALHLSALCVSVAFACFAVRGSTFIVARTAQQELRRLVREVLASPTRRRDALLADILDQLDQVGPQTEENLLAAWPPPLRTQLLDLALDQRSAAGAILAATSGGTCDALDDVGLQSRLLSTMAWCAPRSLRFRLQQFMISGVHTVGRSHAEALRDGDEAAQQALQAELLQLLPSLRRRGVSKLHSMLRAHMQDAADPSLPREEMAAATLDATVLALCTPFVTPLVECGGRRDGLDASALATNFAAMAGSVPLLRLMLDQGYRIDRFGRDGAYPRCLGCPQCCLDDGVMPTGNKAMWFSPQHAAAFAGQLAELEWLERHQPPYRGNRRWPFPARTLLFNASDSTRCDADAPGGLDARGGVPSGSGSEHSGSGQRGGNDSSGDWNGVVESKNSLGDATSNCEIHSVAGVDVAADPRAFFERYVLGGQPVIVRGLSSADGSLAQLGERLGREALLAKLGATEWEIGEIPYEGRYKANAPQPMTLTDYVAAHIDACAPGLVCPYYIFSDRFTRGDTVVSVKDEALTPLPSWAVGRVQASNPPQFYIGGAHTGAPMHFHQAAFNVLVHGRKLWFVTVPKHAVFSMRPAHEWIAERLPAVLERGDSVYRCEQRAGDVLVLPDLWGHLTYNLQTSVGFAQEFRF